mgnify:CR=1 FL=1
MERKRTENKRDKEVRKENGTRKREKNGEGIRERKGREKGGTSPPFPFKACLLSHILPEQRGVQDSELTIEASSARYVTDAQFRSRRSSTSA